MSKRKPNQANQAKHNIAKTDKNNLAQNTYGQNDDAKSGKRCKTNGGQTTDQNDTAKSGKTQCDIKITIPKRDQIKRSIMIS